MKLRHCQVCGHSSRVSVCWSVITEVSSTNTNGSTKNSPTAMARECTATQFSTSRRRRDDAGTELTATLAMSVLTQEAGAATQQDRSEHHAQCEQHQRDDAGGPDVEALEAEVVDQLRQRECRATGVAGLGLLSRAADLPAGDLPGDQRLRVVLHGRDHPGD